MSEKTVELLDGLTDAEITERGGLLIDVLQLRRHKKAGHVFVQTEWGTKTPYGLVLTVERILRDGE